MEEIYILIDKSIGIISKLKKLKDEIFIVTRKEEGSKHISDVQEFFNYSNRIQKINRTRQEIGPKSAVAVFSRVLASAGTLELDLREDLTKKYCFGVT